MIEKTDMLFIMNTKSNVHNEQMKNKWYQCVNVSDEHIWLQENKEKPIQINKHPLNFFKLKIEGKMTIEKIKEIKIC